MAAGNHCWMRAEDANTILLSKESKLKPLPSLIPTAWQMAWLMPISPLMARFKSCHHSIPFLEMTPHEYIPHTSVNLTPWRTARFATIRFTRASYRSISSQSMESRNCLPLRLQHPYIHTSPSCMSTTSKGEGTVS